MNTHSIQDIKIEDKTMFAPLYRKFICFLSVLCLTIGSGTQALADDTEIYFAGAVSEAARPNILLILDTSSSMTKSLEGSTRIEIMKDVMLKVVEEVENVNLGVMIFNKGGDGGHVSYPVTYIDKDLTDNTITRVVAKGPDDAEEDLATGNVVLDNAPLFTSAAVPGTTVNKTYTIQNATDDADEFLNGFLLIQTMATNEFGLFLDGATSSTTTEGMLFRGTDIPKGSRINFATLTLTHNKSKGFEQGTGIITGEKVTAPAGFSDTVQAVGQLKSRYTANPTTSTGVLKTLTNTTAGDTIDADVTAVVDELVNDTTWAGMGPIALYMHDSAGSLIDFYSNSPNSTANAALFPKLTIDHTTPAVVTNDKLLGFRFQNIQLPRGTKVTGARLVLTAASDAVGTTTYLVSGEVPDGVDGSSDPFAAGLTSDLTGRPKTTKVAWTLNNTKTNDSYSSVDLSAVLNQITANSNWCGGNDLTLFVERESFSGDAGRSFYTAESFSTEIMPRLELTYDPATATGCYVAKESAQVVADSDDAEENGSGDVNDGSGDLDISQQFAGVRFLDLGIPQGAQILSARITVVADATNTSGSPTVTIDGELSPDPLTFKDGGGNFDITSRPKTSSGVRVNWAMPQFSQGSPYDTPDLSGIVQEIVNQAGWAAGNAMVFIFGRNSDNRPAVSHDDSPGKAARLEITYRATSGAALVRTARNELLDFISSIVAGKNTPIVEVMYEAGQYWSGRDVVFGASRQGDEFNRLSHPDSYTGGTITWPGSCSPDDMGHPDCAGQVIDPVPNKPVYISPFTSDLTCQKNYQILLTDGSANNNDKGAALIRNGYLGGASCDTKFSDGSSVDFSDEECGVDLVRYMNDNDLNSSLANDQTVITNTVGFVFSDTFLRDMAFQGGGKFYEANGYAELLASFTEFLGDVRDIPTSFVSPSLASNSFNRLLSRDEVYFGLFTPKFERRWPGNLKKYRVCVDTSLGCTLGEILDANGNVATDADNRFKDNSQSIWSDTAPVPVIDGLQTTEGGAGAQMDDYLNDRLIYTDVTKTGAPPASGKSLNNSGFFFNATNWASVANQPIRDQVCGVGAPFGAGSACEELMLWILGDNTPDANIDEDVSVNTRWTVNDILHSSPRVITYGGADTDPTPDGIIDEFWDKIVVGTNEGGVRMFNGKTGKEEWTFMPSALLGQQDLLLTNAQDDHLYGMDGTPTLWAEDVDFDGFIEPSDGDFVYAIQGMRRGGSKYYALDLTATVSSNASQVIPDFLWRIEGGVAGDYARMGQSWADPVLANIKTGGTDFSTAGTNTTVMIIGGGYDTALDTSFGTLGTGGLANSGNAIFFVDPTDGSLIFSISGPGSGADIEVPDMLYSITAEATVADTDGDGDDDRVFIADTAGQVWRIDLGNDIDSGGSPQGSTIVGKLAAISDPLNVADQRRFFEKASFVQVKDSTYADAAGGEYDYILIGTGDRSHPLGTSVNDRFYAFRDRNISPMTDADADNLAEDYPSVTGAIDNSTLIDVTATILDPTDASHRAADGWYYDFDVAGTSGEKVMAAARVVAGTVIFTTYRPDGGGASDPCSANVGTGVAYNLNILNSKAFLDWDTDGTVEDFDDRELALGGGIPSEVVPVFTKEGVVGIVGVEGGAARVGKLAGVPRVRTYWYEEVF